MSTNLSARLVAAAVLILALALAACGGGSGSDTADATPSDGGITSDGAALDATIACNGPSDCAAFDDACNQGACVEHRCVTQAANEGEACDDGHFCTVGDHCAQGACLADGANDCSGGNPCVTGICDEAAGSCSITPNDGAACDDGDQCTDGDICVGSTCVGGQPTDCSALDGDCAVGICAPEIGCQSMPINEGDSCDDGLNCTLGDVCSNGDCAAVPDTCEGVPFGVCQVAMCSEDSGCFVATAPDGTACDDGNPCTSGDMCQQGSCAPTQILDGVACSDGDACTAGETCSTGVCGGPISTVTTCIAGDNCCPAGCTDANDADCLYWRSGVQQNVPASALVGWTQCYADSYADSGTSISGVLTDCNKAKLLMACRPVGATSFTLLAMAPRADVTFDCGAQTSCTQQSNGVGWYFSANWSWGFAPGGEAVNRNSCDYNAGGQQDANQRLCWHTGDSTFNSGYRCGDNDLNGNGGWQRVIYMAD